jgi:hypothetical protein
MGISAHLLQKDLMKGIHDMDNNKEKPIPPLALRYGQAKSRICNAVNDAAQFDGIPFFMLESILTDILHQARENAKKEREEAMRSYDKQMAEFTEGERCREQ